MKKTFSGKIKNSFQELCRLLEELQVYLSEIRIAPASTRKTMLITEELITNIIKYGYNHNECGTIQLKINPNPSQLKMELTDYAAPFDPTRIREIEIPDSIHNLKIGGLGLKLVQTYSSSMGYERVDNMNILELEIPIEIETQRKNRRLN